jgi:putative transposase
MSVENIQPQRGCVIRRTAMPQSLSAVYIHLVFSTKHRQALLKDEGLRSELHAFLGGTSKTLECPPLIVGGVEDHVHLLARFGRSITQADWVKELKRVSNLWLKKEAGITNFEWQAGYADFSVSQSNLEQVKRYIANQKNHHRKLTFQDELRELLTRHRVEWDERYIWE